MANVHVSHQCRRADVAVIDVRIELTGMELEATDLDVLMVPISRDILQALQRERTSSRARTVTK